MNFNTVIEYCFYLDQEFKRIYMQYDHLKYQNINTKTIMEAFLVLFLCICASGFL